jgi:hypothetical protein
MQIHIEHVHVNAVTPPIDVEALLQRLAAQQASQSGGDSLDLTQERAALAREQRIAQSIKNAAMAQATTPRIGQPWLEQGGVYAGLIRCADSDFHLIVPTAAAGSVERIAWGGYGENESGATSETNGPANTQALADSTHAHEAAQWAHSLDIDGHTDWYLPSRRELRLCWVNVPELFANGWYWTSTQASARSAWCQGFDGGGQGDDGKDSELRARAVRRFKAQ